MQITPREFLGRLHLDMGKRNILQEGKKKKLFSFPFFWQLENL